MTDPKTLQTNLAKLGLYLGKIDGIPGPLTADALVHVLAAKAPPETGVALARAIPLVWWTQFPNRVAMLLAMINAETNFWLIRENLNYDADALVKTWPSRFYLPPADRSSPPIGKTNANSIARNPTAIANAVYGGRMGNNTLGDGWTFRGGGWAQLTGHDEYASFGTQIGVDLLNNPEQVCNVFVSAKLAVAVLSDFDEFKSADAGDVLACRKDWNGGTIGLQAASDSFAKIQILWGLK